MGQANSQQTAENMTKSVASSIIKSLQSLTTQSIIDQSIYGTCSTEVSKQQGDDALTCMLNFADKYSESELRALCSILMTCSSSDIDFTQYVYISDVSDQTADLKSSIENDAETALKQFSQNSNTDQLIKEATTVISDNKTKIVSDIINNINASQSIELHNYSVKGVTFDQSVNVTTKNIQSITEVQDSINKIAVSVTQSSINTTNTIVFVVFIILAIFLVIFGIVLLGKSKDLKDFFHKLLPFLVWFIMSSLVTVIHILTKPEYVSYTMPNETEKHIDVPKLLMWLFIYYMGFAMIIYGYFKFTRRGENGEEGEYKEISHKKSRDKSEKIEDSELGDDWSEDEE